MKKLLSMTTAIGFGLMAVGTASEAQTLRWTSQGDALTLDPHSQNEGPTIAMNGNIYERLVNREPDLSLVPELAVSWEAVEPAKWEFKLREGVKFHGGEDFTASDVVFSINRAKAEASDFKEQVASITGAEAIDDLTVHITTDGPNPILPNQLTSLFMVDEGWATENGVIEPQNFAANEENFATRNTNGTGPFKVDSRAPDEMTVLVRNEAWWGNEMFPGNIQRIEYRPIKNAATRVAALLSGEVDFVLDPPLQDLQRIEAAGELKVATVPQVRTIFFGMDQGVEELRTSNVKGANPFADVRVRKAMDLAIDEEAIQRVVMEGLSFPAGMITSPGVLGNTPDQDAPMGYDLDQAKALMDEAGYGDGFTVRLDCPNDRYNNDEKICQAAVAMLAKIGIDVTLEAITKAQHFPKIQNRETDFYMLGWGVPTLDSHYVFSYLLDGEGSWNATGYSNDKVNDVTAAIATETDLAKREMLIGEAWSQVKDDAPYIPIHHQVIAWGMSDKLDLPIAANDTPYFRFAVMQ
jgi:peptide/nickel transport system substrate-binding protein